MESNDTEEMVKDEGHASDIETPDPTRRARALAHFLEHHPEMVKKFFERLHTSTPEDANRMVTRAIEGVTEVRKQRQDEYTRSDANLGRLLAALQDQASGYTR